MIGKRLSHYEILARIGSGGMGEVYRARDTKLDRDVALKVLPPEMASDPERRQRFEREAKAIAALNHPNIVTVFSVEETNGTHFLTMELVEGRTLAQLLANGAMSLDQLFALAIPLADAISVAHERGVTHRDLKPANIMLDDAGRVKVLDFGLAKLRTEPFGDDAQTVAANEPTTEAGKILGTLAYMSPEQAEGKWVDHRSDIFALGVLLYEMSTGRRPFEGETTASTLASILRDVPPPVITLRDGLPRQLDRIIRRCLDKNPDRRFQSAVDVRVEIENLKTEIDSSELESGASALHSAPHVISPPAEASSGIWTRIRRARIARLLVIYLAVSAAVLAVADLLTLHVGLPDWFLPGAAALLAIGLPILVATAYVQTRTRVRHWLSWRKAISGGFIAFAVWGIVVTAYLVMRAQGIGTVASLVSAGVLEEKGRVLIADFENQTDDPLLGEAVKEAFSVDLSQSPVVTVVGANAVGRALQRMSLDPETPLDESRARELAVREGIPVVVAGRVNPAGSGYVFSVRLLDAKSGDALTAIRESASSDGELVDAIDALSRTLRERIGESIKSTRASKPLASVTTPSLTALQKYTLADRLSGSGGDVERTIALLEEAIAIDSTFAMAHRKLGVVLGNARIDRPRRLAALTKAYEYRERLTDRERYLTSAMYYENVTLDRDKAILAYEGLLEIDPDDDWGLNNLGLLYEARNEYERAEPLFARAVEVDASTINLGNLAFCQTRLGKLDAADSTIARYEELFGDAAYFAKSLTTMVRGDYEGADRVVRPQRERFSTNLLEKRGANWLLAAVASTRGRASEAQDLLAENMEIYEELSLPDEYVAEAAGLALVQHEAGYPDRGRATLGDALARHPIDSLIPSEVPHLGLARSYARRGDAARAREHMTTYRAQVAAGERREPKWAHGIDGYIALAQGNDVEALEHFRRWQSEGGPEDAGPLIMLGEMFDRAQEPDSARVYYERFLSSTDPWRFLSDRFKRARVLVRLGELYEERGDRERAADYYRQFVELWKDADPELQERVNVIRRRIEGLRLDG